MGVYSEDSFEQYFTMMHMIFALLFASAAALPIDDTEEVAAAKAVFQAAFDDAAAGGLSAKQADQIADSYLDNSADVAEAAAAFQAAFDDAVAGGLTAKQAPAPVHEIAAPVAATAAAPAPYFVAPAAGFSYGVSSLHSLPVAHHGYAGYVAYATGYPGYLGYAGALP